MEYELQLKPFVRKDGFKYKIITITDIALHTAKKKSTSSLGEKIKKSFITGEPGRVYAPIQKPSPSFGGNMLILDMIKKDPVFLKMVQEEEKKGYKILVALPNEGIPIFAGEDTKDFIKSKKGKRILRGLAKNKDKDI
jgi:hypothetical protein